MGSKMKISFQILFNNQELYVLRLAQTGLTGMKQTQNHIVVHLFI